MSFSFILPLRHVFQRIEPAKCINSGSRYLESNFERLPFVCMRTRCKLAKQGRNEIAKYVKFSDNIFKTLIQIKDLLISNSFKWFYVSLCSLSWCSVHLYSLDLWPHSELQYSCSWNQQCTPVPSMSLILNPVQVNRFIETVCHVRTLYEFISCTVKAVDPSSVP